MRELTSVELSAVAGGCQTHSSCNPAPSSCGTVWNAATIAAYAGYLAGEYNLQADLYNHASCCTIKSAEQNVVTDTQIGYTYGQTHTTAEATALLNNVVASIHSAVKLGSCGCVDAMSTIDFPSAKSGGGLG